MYRSTISSYRSVYVWHSCLGTTCPRLVTRRCRPLAKQKPRPKVRSGSDRCPTQLLYTSISPRVAYVGRSCSSCVGLLAARESHVNVSSCSSSVFRRGSCCIRSALARLVPDTGHVLCRTVSSTTRLTLDCVDQCDSGLVRAVPWLTTRHFFVCVTLGDLV